MAVAFVGHASFNPGGTSTIAQFNAPTPVNAGDTWMCCLGARGGTGNTFGTLPTGFTQVGRVDNSTNETMALFSYQALGTETAGASFATFTIGASARDTMTEVMAFSGVNFAAGITGNTPGTTATATAQSATNNLVATGANDGLIIFAAIAAASATLTFSGNLIPVTAAGALSGGSGPAANAAGGGYALGAFAAGTTFTVNFASSTAGGAMVATLQAPAASTPKPELLPFNPVARRRSSNW